MALPTDRDRFILQDTRGHATADRWPTCGLFRPGIAGAPAGGGFRARIALLGLGDQQYSSGALSDYNYYYDATWGRVKSITSPSPGNHDPFSSGYSAYFGSGAPARYYS